MAFRQADKFELWRLKNFFDALAKETRKQDVYELTSFDSIASDVLALIMNRCHNEKCKSLPISTYTLAKMTNSTRRRVRRRIEELAKYGMINVKSEWRNDGSNKRKTQMITPNPWLSYLLASGAKPAHKTQAVKHFAGLGISRLESEEPIQGFKINCELGEAEPEEALNLTPEETVQDLNEKIAIEDKNKAQKFKNTAEWREAGNNFAEASAVLWTYAQSKSGLGSAKPNWSGDRSHMPAAAIKERNELTKVFQQYGGRVSALAWYIFVCGIPDIDPGTGKRVFDPRSPHRQFITTDKKPSSFSKHFNSILQDTNFKNLAKKDWLKTEESLRNFYQHTLDRAPRDGGHDSDKIGFDFGDTAPSLNEVV